MQTIKLPEIPEIHAFLLCPTPAAWVEVALDNLETLLIDHAQCEKKAAATAMSLIHRYPTRTELLLKMSQLAREELLHFEQVLGLLAEKNWQFGALNPGNYAKTLHKHINPEEPHRLIESLILGSIIEARSCERFLALIPRLIDQGETRLARYYASLVKAEARHFEDYLHLARLYSPQPIDEQINKLLTAEAEYITSPDTTFRFHSGLPA